MIEYKGLSNEQLFELVKNSADNQAYRELYDRLYPRLYSFGVKQHTDAEEVKDIIQDAFLKIWTNRNEIVITSSIHSYLNRSVMNGIFMLNRGQKMFDNYQEYLKHQFNEGLDSTENIIAMKETQQRINNAMELMRPKARLVFEERYLGDMKNREISSKHNMNKGSVQSYLRDAMSIIRKAGLKLNSLF